MKTVVEIWHKAWPDSGAFVRASAQDLERFAALVAAAERERIFKELLRMHENTKGAHNYFLHAVGTIRARGETK